jgi:hypothetical protein
MTEPVNPIENFIKKAGECLALLETFGADGMTLSPRDKDDKPLAFICFTTDRAKAEVARQLWEQAEQVVDQQQSEALRKVVADGLLNEVAEFTDLTFSEALDCVKGGARIQREGWNGPGQFVELQRPDEHSKMGLPYLYITTVDGKRVPWLASQTDLLAADWRVVRAAPSL